jgi:hypothetical protein
VKVANNPFQVSMTTRCKAAIAEAISLDGTLHAGLKGQLREILAGKLIFPTLPPEVRIGTGQLVSVNGQLSPQSDVILYAPSILPPSLYDEKSGLFPVESCLYSIEIKSKLTATELQSAIKNAQDVRTLPLLQTDHWVKGPDSARIVSRVIGNTPFCISALFAFGSDLTGDGSKELARYRAYDPVADVNPAIAVICIVGKGYWYSTMPGWNFVAATGDIDEVMSFLAGTTNTLPQLLASKGSPRFGMYLASPNSDTVKV